MNSPSLDRQNVPKTGTVFGEATECHVIIAPAKLVRHRGFGRLGMQGNGYEALWCLKTGVSENFQYQYNPFIPPYLFL